MKKRIIKIFDKVILLLLGFSGTFYSCREYGMPEAEFQINGTVMDKTGKPIQNIQVARLWSSEYGDTLYTGTEGKYSFHGMSPEFHLKFEDIDSVENGGEFETQEIRTRLTQADQVEKGEGKWNNGKYVKTVNIELETKK